MSRPPISMRGWSFGDSGDEQPDPAPVRWPDAWRFTPAQCATFLALQRRYQTEAPQADPDATRKRLRFWQLMAMIGVLSEHD